MLISLDCGVSCTASINFDKYSLLNSDGVKSCSISIASNKTLCEENTRFVELLFRGKTIKAKSIHESEADKKNDKFK